MHVYNVEDISDGHIPSDVKIGWPEDSLKCVFLINRYPDGVFDFEGEMGIAEAVFRRQSTSTTSQ